MKKLLLTFILFAFLLPAALAQTGQVRGKFINQLNEPLPNATATLIHLPDSANVQAKPSDNKGSFSFDHISPGMYLLKGTLVGYSSLTTNALTITDQVVDLPVLVLLNKAISLSQVTILSRTPVIEQKSDRMVVHVDKMNTAGDNALDVLAKSPSVRLDKDDNILFRNNGGVNVLIDGKETYMSGSELSNYLKLLPGNIINKIELIANPPGNYDAEGTAGIINVILKRNRLVGYNGNVVLNGGYGKYGKLNSGLNFNYNIDKLSLYSRLNEGYNSTYNKLTLNRDIGDQVYNETNFFQPKIYSTSYVAGADYYATKNQTWGFLFKGLNAPMDINAVSNSNVVNAGNQVISRIKGINPQNSGNNTYNLNLNYSINLDTLGQKLGFDADFVSSNSSNNQIYTNYYNDANGNLLNIPVQLKSNNPINYSIYSLKSDYVYHFARKWLLETGIKSSYVTTRSDMAFDSLKSTGFVLDTVRSNNFKYTEMINAVYVNLSTNFGSKWDVKASLRTEQTISNANSISRSQIIDRDYIQFFPSAFVTFKPNDKNQLNLSYSRRISRPNYNTLNAAIRYTDPYTAIQGNPYLLPSISQSYLFNYTYNNFEVISLSYLQVGNSVNSIVAQNDSTKESVSKYENLGRVRTWSATSSSNFNIKSWWNVNLEVDLLYNEVSTLLQNGFYDTRKVSWTAVTQQDFTLPESFKLQLTGVYFSPTLNGVARMLSGSQIDLGLSRSFLKRKATVSLKARDIFFGNRYRSLLIYNNINTRWQNEFESRRFSLTLMYGFGNTKIKNARTRNTGTTQEEGRMQP